MPPASPWILGIALLAGPALALADGPATDAGLESFRRECAAGHLAGCSDLAGARELARVLADLDQDGVAQDVVLVLEKQGRPSDRNIVENRRPLLILLRQADGSLRLAKRNDAAVCSTCEDLGDVVSASAGRFTVTRTGWNLTRQGTQYTFAFSRRDQTWQLVRVEERVLEDPDAETTKTLAAWTPPQHFGKIDVADFDPDNWKGQGPGYQGLATPSGPLRKLIADVRALLGVDSALEQPLREALDALGDLDRKNNLEAANALRSFVAMARTGTAEGVARLSGADRERLAAAAEQIVRQLASSTTAAPRPSPGTTAYRSQRQAIAFQHPGRWSVGECPGRANCLAVYARQTDRASHRSLATLELLALGFEKAAEHAGFEKQAGAWVMPGRFEASQAEVISGPGWKGIAVTQACSVSDAETGFHAAGGECLTAVLSARDRSVVVQTPGQPPPGSEVNALLRSVRFLESRK